MSSMDEIYGLVRDGYSLCLIQNEDGSYTAFAVPRTHEEIKTAMYDADEVGALFRGGTIHQSIRRLHDAILDMPADTT